MPHNVQWELNSLNDIITNSCWHIFVVLSQSQSQQQQHAQLVQAEAHRQQQEAETQRQEAHRQHQEAHRQHQEAHRQHQEAQQRQAEAIQQHNQAIAEAQARHQQQQQQNNHLQHQQQQQLQQIQFQPKGRMPRVKGDAKPKGRMTAYAFFVQTCREEHKKKHPEENVVFTEFTKKCAERWKVRVFSDMYVDIFFVLSLTYKHRSDVWCSYRRRVNCK